MFLCSEWSCRLVWWWSSSYCFVVSGIGVGYVVDVSVFFVVILVLMSCLCWLCWVFVIRLRWLFVSCWFWHSVASAQMLQFAIGLGYVVVVVVVAMVLSCCVMCW